MVRRTSCPPPGSRSPQAVPILIKNGTVVNADGYELLPSPRGDPHPSRRQFAADVLLVNGKIEAVGQHLSLPDGKGGSAVCRRH